MYKTTICDEKIITIQCKTCNEIRKVNNWDWVNGKLYSCNNCKRTEFRIILDNINVAPIKSIEEDFSCGTCRIPEFPVRDVEVRKLAIKELHLCKNCVNRFTKEELYAILAHRFNWRK